MINTDARHAARMDKLAIGRRALMESARRLEAEINVRKSRLNLRCEDSEILLALRRRPEETAERLLVEQLVEVRQQASVLTRIQGLLPSGRRIHARAAKAADELTVFRAEAPRRESIVRRAVRDEAEINARLNLEAVQKVAGSLPRRLKATNLAVRAVESGDPAVCTCVIRGQTELVLRNAVTWDDRRAGRNLSPDALSDYLDASFQRDTLYEEADEATAAAEAAAIRRAALPPPPPSHERLEAMLMMLIRGQSRDTASPVMHFEEAEWEEVTDTPPLRLRPPQKS